MNIDEIIEVFNNADGYFPEEALNAALEQQETITPRLLSILESTVSNYKNISNDQMDYIFALYLLSKFREKRAFPHILALASLPSERLEELLGDCITEGLSGFIVSTFDGDISAIKKIVEDTTLNEWSRNAALKSLLGLVALDKLSREEVINYLRSLFHSPLFDDENFVTHLVDVAVSLYPEELLDEINRAFEAKKVDLCYFDKEWVEDVFAEGKEKCLENYVYHDDSHLPIDDVEREMRWMSVFWPKNDLESRWELEPDYLDELDPVNTYVRETPKIGRNDPCLCGSGKKFKKCCLNSKMPVDIAKNHDEYLY